MSGPPYGQGVAAAARAPPQQLDSRRGSTRARRPSPRTRPSGSRVEYFLQQLLVPADPFGAIGIGDDELPAAASHLLELVAAADQVADRIGHDLRPAGGHDDAAADGPDEPRRLAVLLGGDNHRTRRRQHAVQPARDDVAGER